VRDAAAEFGGVDVLMNIAGVVRGVQVRHSSGADAAFHIEVNLLGVIHGCRVAAGHMAARGSGHIINIASLAGLVPVPGLSLYNASKFGVRGFSHALAAELAPLGVQVTVVCPDAVATPMLDAEAFEPDAAMSFSGGKILSVEEVTGAIVERALRRRPREMILPSSMAPLTRLVTAFPAASRLLLGAFQAKGRKEQEKYRKRLEGGERL
jgi:3-oxoacyl-[acyl-carrier protein] reductase